MASTTDENSDRLEVVQEKKQQGKVDAINGSSSESTITEDMDCLEAFQIVISVLYQLNEKYGDAMLSQERILQLQNHHDNNKAVISFYGTSNGGKSSILNSVLGAKYLPINVQNETAVSVKIMFKLKDEKKSNPTKKCQLSVNGEEESLSPREVCSSLKSINEKLRDTKMSNESSSYECTLSINHPVKCITEENDVVVFLDTPGLDEFGSEKISQCVSMAENISSAFIFVTTFTDYKRDKLSYMLQELYKKDKDILKDDRLTIVINKMDEALKKRGGEKYYTKDSVISDVQNYFCTVVFHCKPEEWPKKSIIVLCSSWSLYTRTSAPEDSMHLIDLCRTTLLTDDCDKRSLTEEPNVVKQNEVLELHSNILELESRLQEMSTRSLLLWTKKLMLDLSILLADAKENLIQLLSSKEKDCEDLQKTMVLYTTAFQYYHTFSKKIVVNYKKAKKKSLPKDIEIAGRFRDAFSEDMKNTNLKELMWDDVWQELSNFSNSILEQIDLRKCSPMVFKTELSRTAKSIFKRLEARMNSSEELSKVFLTKSTRINMEIEVLVSQFSKISFSENQFATEPVIGHPNVPIPSLKAEVRIPLKLKWTQELAIFLWGGKKTPPEPDMVLSNENSMAVMNQEFEDLSEEFLEDILDIIPEQEDHQEEETDLIATLEEDLENFAEPHENECAATNTENAPVANTANVSTVATTHEEKNIAADKSLLEQATSINDLSIEIMHHEAMENGVVAERADNPSINNTDTVTTTHEEEGSIEAVTRIAEDTTSTSVNVDVFRSLVQNDQDEDHTQEQDGSTSDTITSTNEASATPEQDGSISDVITSRNEASATPEQDGSTSDAITSTNEASATPEQTGRSSDTNTCSSEASVPEDSMSPTDKKMSMLYTNWSPKMDFVLNKIHEDFTAQITKYLGDPNNVIMQYCGQYYETAAKILTEFKTKNGDVINKYRQKFSEIKKQKTDLEMERKVISSYIKQIEDFIKVLEAIDSKAPYSKQSL